MGIDVKLRPSPDFGTWLKRIAGWDFDLSVDLPFNFPDPVIGVHRLFLCTNIKHIPWTNVGGYCSPRVDEILNKAASEMDFQKRRALYVEFQKIITQDLPMYFLDEPALLTIYHRDLRNIPESIWGVMAPIDKLYWKDGRAPK